ncbi:MULTISPECIES: hypothetical protein [unclassified Microbacterium]|uniref:hypothetical protein n=1 Tax=unclassified Microbacterium TaxID=2609290 RepID=UPI00109B7616|nr:MULTISPECIES: hypothetical protein [unclassified Microbacterium]
MEPLVPAAPWLMAAAALVSAVACVAAWRAVPWQGRQSALVMAAGMLVLAIPGVDALTRLALGAVLLVSAMLGTMGVRGTAAAATCCHRALVSLVMAVCAFDGSVVVSSVERAVTPTGHGGHGLGGVLSALVMIGVAAVVLWTVAAAWFVPPLHHGRTGRLLATESWAMAAGVAVMCLGF